MLLMLAALHVPLRLQWHCTACHGEWRAARGSPRVAREAREARLSVNPAAHARRGSCSTGDSIANAVAVTPTLLCRSKAPFAFSPPKFSLLFFFIGVCYFQAAYSCIIVEYRYSVGGGAYSRNMHMHMCVFSYHWLRVEKERKRVYMSGVHCSSE